MRKHLYLITSHPNEDFSGHVEIRDKAYVMGEKNTETTIRKRDPQSGNGHTQRVVGLGYVDFEDQADYEENIGQVMKEKLGEIDPDHLVTAGLDPVEALA